MSTVNQVHASSLGLVCNGTVLCWAQKREDFLALVVSSPLGAELKINLKNQIKAKSKGPPSVSNTVTYRGIANFLCTIQSFDEKIMSFSSTSCFVLFFFFPFHLICCETFQLIQTVKCKWRV